MPRRLTLVLALLEAAVLLVMKWTDWHEAKKKRPAAGKAQRAAGRRVVNPSQPAYDEELTPGDQNAAYLPAGSSAADEKIHKETERRS